jgi:hypothetical protein
VQSLLSNQSQTDQLVWLKNKNDVSKWQEIQNKTFNEQTKIMNEKIDRISTSVSHLNRILFSS